MIPRKLQGLWRFISVEGVWPALERPKTQQGAPGNRSIRGKIVKVGDLVRLKQPFVPEILSLQVYDFGIVAGIVSEESTAEVLLHLFDPKSSNFYRDETGIKAIYSFQLDEVETWTGNSHSLTEEQ